MQNRPVTMRFTESTMTTIDSIDRICNEFNLSRPKAIKLVFDRLQSIDPTISNPTNLAPQITL